MLSIARREPSALLAAQLAGLLLYPFMKGSDAGRALFSVFGIGQTRLSGSARMSSVDAGESASDFWDRRYRDVERLWPQEANAQLVAFAAGLSPGRALDIGAGEGRNAVWLAKSGWRVTALDVSEVGLERAAKRAAEEGVELECVVGDWREHVPASPIELAVISFMHPPPDERAAMFERARAALTPGGHLFTVGVDVVEHGRRGPPDPDRLYTPERLSEALVGFDVLRCESVAYEGEAREGRRAVVDVVAIAQRPWRE